MTGSENCLTPNRFARFEGSGFIPVPNLCGPKRMFDDVSMLQNYLSSLYKTARQSKASAKVMLSEKFNQSILGCTARVGAKKEIAVFATSIFELREKNVLFKKDLLSNYLLRQYQAMLTLANARLLTASATLNHRFSM